MARCGKGEAKIGQGAGGPDDDEGRLGDGDGLEHGGGTARAAMQRRRQGLAAGPRNDNKDGGPAAFPGREATTEVEGAAAEPMVKATWLDGYWSDCEWQPGLARTGKSSDSRGRQRPCRL
ncbi:hypothetical protein E2562_038848 [Oryza meyeriana var. granulata]|uniref:DUF834 domain-containing protein n=1 Tax=Oryza meyeriana var. granulata TaxID=110450 RepID=A0A6G1FGW5_9ORYZ|nr:hypothetical protein E2562_038848 [Oryza meyeriana var. granulata]